jgi:hypothetical protein
MEYCVTQPQDAVKANIVFEAVGSPNGSLSGNDFFFRRINFWAKDDVYWLANNRLAALALAPYETDIAHNISATVASYGPYGLDHTTVLLENECLLQPSLTRENVTLEETGEHVLVGGRQTTRTLEAWSAYADVMLQHALSYWMNGNKPSAWETVQQVIRTYDGTGFWDLSTRATGEYDAYTLALFLVTLQVTGQPFEHFHEVEARIWANQDPATGGIISGINRGGKPSGQPDTETTSLALLLYDKNRIAMLRDSLGCEPAQMDK